MALPFPHGTASGQIGHGVSIDDADAPGSVGGRFVAFGEDGLSRTTNRSSWALSKNIDYIYQTYSAAKAAPGFYNFVSAAQDYANLPGEVFVGNSSYPGGSPPSEMDRVIGLSLLFSVVGANYAVLTDTIGHEVRVYDVRTSDDSATVYKGGLSPAPGFNGFHTTPKLKFCLVDPSTLEVTDADYTIPTSTIVNVIYGTQASLETLSIDALLRVMFSKNGIPGGVILQNGTRPMLAALDLSNNQLSNVERVDGGAGVLKFTDVNTGLLPLSETGEGSITHDVVPAAHLSLLGAINSATKTLSGFVQNRVIVKTGSLTFDGSTGNVNIPAGNVYTIGGETFVTPTGGYTVVVPADAAAYFVAIDHGVGHSPNRSLIIAPMSGLAGLSGSSLIIAQTARAVSGTFSAGVDLRTTGRRLAGKFDVFVGGDGSCDFSNLQNAVDFVAASALCLPTSTGSYNGWRPRLIVRGSLTVGEENIITLPTSSTPFAWELIR